MAQNVTEKNLFIIDDEPIQNEMLKDYLEERYLYKVAAFENGEDALKQIDILPEIVVLDYHLSSTNKTAKNGVEILKQIKEASPDTHVIMLSGQDKIEVAIDTMKYGAYDYVVKGESAFSRIENIINKASEYNKMKLINTSQKKAITFLSIVIGLIFLWSIYFFIVKPNM